MPGFDQLNDIPEERRAALLGRIRALPFGIPAIGPGSGDRVAASAARATCG